MATRLYTVQKHDNILNICLMFDITYDYFIALNPQFGPTGHRNEDQLEVGEVLVVGVDPLDLVRKKRK